MDGSTIQTWGAMVIIEVVIPVDFEMRERKLNDWSWKSLKDKYQEEDSVKSELLSTRSELKLIEMKWSEINRLSERESSWTSFIETTTIYWWCAFTFN